MSHDTLSDFVEATATEFGIPGVAVGVWADGQEVYACHGVTSVDNPLPVDRDTLYVLGSVTKTYTATALMRLVAEGRVELHAPVRRYVPELRLADDPFGLLPPQAASSTAAMISPTRARSRNTRIQIQSAQPRACGATRRVC